MDLHFCKVEMIFISHSLQIPVWKELSEAGAMAEEGVEGDGRGLNLENKFYNL